MTNNELKNKLQAIADQEENSIEKQVVIEALGYESVENFFSDIMHYG